MNESVTTNPERSALRAGMRPVLRAVLSRPGSLYQPLILAGLSAVDPLEADIQGLAEAAGIPAYFGYGEEIHRALSGGSPAVAVFDLAAFRASREAGFSPGHRQQMIVWSSEEPEALEPELAEAASQGLILDPRALARHGGDEWSMGPTLARCARDPGALYNPVLLVAPSARLPFVADEASLRLEAAGIRPVLTLSGTVSVDEPAVAGLQAGAGLVLRLSDGPGAGVREAIQALLDRGVQLVLALSERAHDALKEDDAGGLLDHAITLIVTGGQPSGAASPQGEDGAWPPAEDLLVGTPDVGPDPDRMMSGSLETFPLPDLLQTFAGGRHTGRLVVFSASHFGVIDLEGGRVVYADSLDDEWTAESLADRSVDADASAAARRMVEQRTCTIGRWDDAHFTFFVGRNDALARSVTVELAVDALAMEIARRRDEALRQERRTGGMGRILVRTDSDKSAPERARRLLDALDGTRSLYRIGQEVGLLRDELLEAAAHLVQHGQAEPAGMGEDAPAVAVDAVVRRLFALGLRSEAGRVLTEASDALTPEAQVLLGHHLAASDPQGATAAFAAAARHLGEGAAGPVFFDASLNALLLEVRGRQQSPEDAWAEVRALLGSRHRSHARTVRHYGIVAELALRAGQRTMATQAIDTLMASGGEEGARVAALYRPFLKAH